MDSVSDWIHLQAVYVINSVCGEIPKTIVLTATKLPSFPSSDYFLTFFKVLMRDWLVLSPALSGSPMLCNIWGYLSHQSAALR